MLHADTVSVGVVSFNTLIPGAPGSPGVNDFEIDNFTGPFDLAPDFPSVTSLSFNNVTLILSLVGGGTQTITLGNLTAGSYTPVNLQFSASDGFSSAQLTATLNQTTFSLSGGSSFSATSAQLSVLLTPNSGPSLTPDTDFSLISVSDAAATSVPEPATSWAVGATLASVIYASRRKRFLGKKA